MDTILICGYGVMGRGVAASFAAAGFRTIVWSRRARELGADGSSGGITFTHELPSFAPRLAIELAPEDIATKARVYAALEAQYPETDVVIATGTSGLDLRVLAAHLVRPQRFVGLHYFMPAQTAPIVEVMAGPATPRETVDAVATLVERTGKEPVRVYQPIIGFLVNRLQHAMLNEAYYLIEAGVASASDIDRAARRLLGPRMCTGGLIEQKDVSGLRIHAEAQRSIVPALHHDGVPNAMLQSMVARGETGLDAGAGFYEWRGRDVASTRADAARALESLLRALDDMALPASPPVRDPR